jgi:hypothetical protein
MEEKPFVFNEIASMAVLVPIILWHVDNPLLGKDHEKRNYTMPLPGSGP